MSSFMIRKHCCFKCGEEEKYIINTERRNYECRVTPGNTQILQATYIDKNKVEVEYECSKCHNKNKIVVNL